MICKMVATNTHIDVSVTSMIPYLTIQNGPHHVKKGLSIRSFVENLGVTWDDDALIVVNSKIITDGDLQLNHKDDITLLIPITGG